MLKITIKKLFKILITGIMLSAVIGCDVKGNSSSTADSIFPTVASMVPISDGMDAAIDTNLTATFSEAMDPLTITDTTFTLLQGSTAITGSVTYSDMVATFNPTISLDNSTAYTVTLSTAVQDIAGNNLEQDKVWSFTTIAPGSVTETTPPTVQSTFPTMNATDMIIEDNITVTFSEEMDPLTITGTTFSVKEGLNTVAGTITYAGMIATFNPTNSLVSNTDYVITVTTGVKDLAGNTMAVEKVLNFKTIILDIVQPTVVSTFPINSNTDIPINSNITITFDERMDYATIIPVNFTVSDGSPVAGSVTYQANNTAVFSPDINLSKNTIYTVTIAAGVTDIAGNALNSDEVWTFTTAVDGLGPEPVRLGTAGNFAILAKTAVSTVPASIITGDVGVSPVAATYLTGFSQTDGTGYATSPQVTGFLYAADMTPPTPTMMITAVSDMEIAYTDAAGRITPDFTNLKTGTLNADILAPGLYKWGTSVVITGDITIDGSANDVWIFQITDNLSIDSNTSIILSGGALASNIFWQVAGEVTLQAAAHFEGVILSKTAIIMVTGSSVNGRLLAQSNVALDKSTVTEPSF